MIKIFIRHCNSQESGSRLSRPFWFSKESAFLNLIKTSSFKNDICIIFDGNSDLHFIKNYNQKIIHIEDGGSDTKSFRFLINYILSQNINDEDIIYILEDDYIHVQGWDIVMSNGFNDIGPDYMTLYDHYDKYTKMYPTLKSQIILSRDCHWRTTPSTTNTYACKFKTLKKHANIHLEFADISKKVTDDHGKFISLWKNGSNLISPIPGYSTHCVDEFLSPMRAWNTII